MLRLSARFAKGGPVSAHARSLRTVALTTAIAAPILIGLTAVLGIVSVFPSGDATPGAKQAAQKTAFAFDPRFLDPVPMQGKDAPRGWSSTPLAPAIAPARGLGTASAPSSSKIAAVARAAPQSPAPAPDEVRTAQTAQIVPLPVPRPRDLTPPASSTPPAMARATTPRRLRTVAAPAAPVDNRSFFERLFDLNSPAASTYAALDSKPIDVAPRPRLTPSPLPAPAAEALTAIYDITSQTVTLPNGERLEAHSGLGDKMDDPRFVHLRMRGATPPGTYDLTEREAPFHGVRAIRLNPVGGSGTIHGRAGLLAHTYLLGPKGDSNGCVSFKDYDRFLEAYLRGDVRRLVVVGGRGQDRLPVTAGRRLDNAERWDSRARG